MTAGSLQILAAQDRYQLELANPGFGSTVEDLPIARAIDMRVYGSALLYVTLHAVQSWPSTATVQVLVRNVTVLDGDDYIAGEILTTLDVTNTPGKLFLGAVGQGLPIGDSVQVLLRVTYPTSATGPLDFTANIAIEPRVHPFATGLVRVLTCVVSLADIVDKGAVDSWIYSFARRLPAKAKVLATEVVINQAIATATGGYNLDDFVDWSSIYYRSLVTTANTHEPPNGSFWTVISDQGAYTNNNSYSTNDFVSWSGSSWYASSAIPTGPGNEPGVNAAWIVINNQGTWAAGTGSTTARITVRASTETGGTLFNGADAITAAASYGWIANENLGTPANNSPSRQDQQLVAILQLAANFEYQNAGAFTARVFYCIAV